MEMTISRKGMTWVSVAERLYKTRQAIKSLAEEESILCNELKELSNYKNAFGGEYLFTVTFRKGAVEYDVIPELKGLNLEPYRKEDVAMWKLQKVGA